MAMRRPVPVEELGFSHNTELALKQANIQWDTELEETWKNCSIHEIEDSLSRTPCFNSLTVIEITIRFALTGTSVTQKIDEHTQYLIEKDVPYSNIRFWESLKMVLQCLPEKRYLHLSSERLQHYCKSYEFVVQYIFKDSGATVEEIVPEEDYFDLKCPICETVTSYYFKDIFLHSCRLCQTEEIARFRGFNTYQADEDGNFAFSDDVDLSRWENSPNDTAGGHFLQKEEPGDLAFVCQLCNKALPERFHLGTPELLEKAKALECPNCEGRKWLTILAELSDNRILFRGRDVIFCTIDPGTKEVERKRVRTVNLNPNFVWEVLSHMLEEQNEKCR